MQTIIFGRVIKVGNSLAVVIPKKLAREMDFRRGDLVTYIVVEENSITLKKVTDEKIADLKLEETINI